MAKPELIRTRMDQNKDQLDLVKIDQLERQFLEFLYELGNSRELSRAKGHIEEAAMWMKKHIQNR